MVPQEVFEALELFIKLFEASQRSAKKKKKKFISIQGSEMHGTRRVKAKNPILADKQSQGFLR